MDQVSIKYTNIFQCKTLQNLPKFGFLVWKHTIWQPWLGLGPTQKAQNCTHLLELYVVKWHKLILMPAASARVIDIYEVDY
jgi:hypothetical protein